MLLGIHVKNFAIIDEAELTPDSNLNILTGETGAGKSILLGAVNMALGARIGKEVIRSGADYALAEIIFSCTGKRVRDALCEMELPIEDELIISRKLMSNGRNVVRINGETATTANVRQLASLLLDIHGQHEGQSLSDPEKHLAIIDKFAGSEVSELKENIRKEYTENYAKARKELQSFDTDTLVRAREADMLRFSIKEIEEAELYEGEEEELKAEHRLLANAQLIAEGVGGAAAALNDEEGVSELLGRAIKALSRVSDFDPKIGGFMDTLSDAESLVSDAGRELADYISDLPDDRERLFEVEDRLNLISRLMQKYGSSVSKIQAYAEESAERLEKLEDYERYESELKEKLNASEEKLLKLQSKLTKLRKKKAAELDKLITEALLDLNFNKVSFVTEFNGLSGVHAEGADEAQFMISLNPGEEPRPLVKIASGGEMSRIMLAIKSVLADSDDIETLIFDEIDTGISGRTAQKVSEKMAVIAKRHQVLCITHLPQIAAMADVHFSIEKHADENSTETVIRRIEGDEITLELARLLGGAEITDSVMAGAAEMKKLADEKKTEIRS